MNQNDYSPIPLQPNTVYHIFSHAVNNNNLFQNIENYHYFLRKWEQLSKEYFRTYAFCLMPNHFHLCVQTMPLEIKAIEKESYKASNTANLHYHSKQISNFLSSYTQSLNKQQQRKGALFRSTFGRIPVKDEIYFKDLICYIHHNPIHHFNVEFYHEWQFSSFNAFKYDNSYTFLNTSIPINRFGGENDYFDYHEKYQLERRFSIIEQNVVQYYKKIGIQL